MLTSDDTSGGEGLVQRGSATVEAAERGTDEGRSAGSFVQHSAEDAEGKLGRVFVHGRGSKTTCTTARGEGGDTAQLIGPAAHVFPLTTSVVSTGNQGGHIPGWGAAPA